MFKFIASINDGYAYLDEYQTHHLRNVFRANIHERVLILDGIGGIYDAVVIEFSKNSTKVQIQNKVEQREVRNHVHVILSAIRIEKIELTIEKLTELGVHEIIITKTKFSQFNLGILRNKVQRFEKIAKTAMEQSGNPIMPKILLCEFEKIDYKSDSEKLVMEISGEDFRNVKIDLTKDVYVLIGSEGGFAKEEFEKIKSMGFKPIKISQNTLRAETAAIISAGLLI